MHSKVTFANTNDAEQLQEQYALSKYMLIGNANKKPLSADNAQSSLERIEITNNHTRRRPGNSSVHVRRFDASNQ
jgi:hypothetical protein